MADPLVIAAFCKGLRPSRKRPGKGGGCKRQTGSDQISPIQSKVVATVVRISSICEVFMSLGLVCTCSAQVPPLFRTDINLVRVAVSASDGGGRPIRNLQRDDFVLVDNNTRRPIQYMWRENDTPLIVGLIADISGSQRNFINQHRDALKQFIKQVLRPQDRAFLISVCMVRRLFASGI